MHGEQQRKERGDRRGEGRREDAGGRGKSARPQGREAITKLQKLTIKPDRHTGATIKLVRRPADRRIFLVFTTNHVAARRTSSSIRVSLPSRECMGRAGGFSPRKENCTAILHRHSKCRCKTSALLPSSLPHLPPRSRLPIRISSHHSSCFPGNPFAVREYESVRRNDEGIRIKSYFPRCFAIRRLKYHKTAGAERLSKDWWDFTSAASADLSLRLFDNKIYRL